MGNLGESPIIVQCASSVYCIVDRREGNGSSQRDRTGSSMIHSTLAENRCHCEGDLFLFLEPVSMSDNFEERRSTSRQHN